MVRVVGQPPRGVFSHPLIIGAANRICQRNCDEVVAVESQVQFAIHASTGYLDEWNLYVQGTSCEVHALDIGTDRGRERKIAGAVLVGYSGGSRLGLSPIWTQQTATNQQHSKISSVHIRSSH